MQRGYEAGDHLKGSKMVPSERRRRGQHIRPTERAARSATDSYRLLATQVVRQAHDDSAIAAFRADVLHSIRTGTLAWWLAQAGVEDCMARNAVETITARAGGH